jgi:hypothetical protein
MVSDTSAEIANKKEKYIIQKSKFRGKTVLKCIDLHFLRMKIMNNFRRT